MGLVDDTAEWHSALTGDGTAFGVLFERHKTRVRRHLTRLVESPEDADDALAIVFLEAWRKRDSVRVVDRSILPWLLTTATYVANNARRSARRYNTFLEQLPKVIPQEPGLEDTDALMALRHLSLADRQVLTLCVIEGWSETDAATVLGLRPGTVKSRLHRAKRRLAVAVQTHAPAFQKGQ